MHFQGLATIHSWGHTRHQNNRKTITGITTAYVNATAIGGGVTELLRSERALEQNIQLLRQK